MQQLAMGITATEGLKRPEFGLRINPQFSTGNINLYNPCTIDSRLGTIRSTLERNLQGLSQYLFKFNKWLTLSYFMRRGLRCLRTNSLSF